MPQATRAPRFLDPPGYGRHRPDSQLLYQLVEQQYPAEKLVAFSCKKRDALQRLFEQIGAQVGQVLERRGLIERDIEKAWLAPDNEAGPLDDLIGHSITDRIAVGPRAGRKLFTLQTVPPRLLGPELDPNGADRAPPGHPGRRACQARPVGGRLALAPVPPIDRVWKAV